MTEVVRRAQPNDAAALAGKPVSTRLQRVYDRHRGTCALCGGRTFLTVAQGHPQKATIDHVIPLSRGGSNRQENLQLACERCNNQKANRVGPDMVRKLAAERDKLLAEVKMLRAAVTSTTPQVVETLPAHLPLGVPTSQFEACKASWARQRKNWAATHQQMQQDILRFKAALLAAPEGDIRHHLVCVERTLEQCRNAAARETTVDGIREAIDALVGRQLEMGRRFREMAEVLAAEGAVSDDPEQETSGARHGASG